MKRILLIVLSVAALVGFFSFDDARRDHAVANQSRCAVFDANDFDCPYSHWYSNWFSRKAR